MRTPPEEYEDLGSALQGIAPLFQLPISRFIEDSQVLQSAVRKRQMKLSDFVDTNTYKKTGVTHG
jgi:hypothetical protein